MNNKQATIAGILACGLVEEVGRSKKYRVFKENTPDGVPSFRWLVGKSGALRYISPGGPLRRAISESVSKTGSSSHRAFLYCGRIAETVKGGIHEAQYRDIWSAVVRSEIPVTKDGYHADRQ